MIASLRGTVLHKDAEGAVIECAGVGYGLRMSLSSLTRLPEEGSTATLFVHTHLSQDALRLYGFADAAERRAFEVLIAITGVGPRLALAILSFLAPAELAAAVENGDRGALVKVPGVGAKKADRLLVELKGRMLDAELQGDSAPELTLRDDLVGALGSLGFPPKDAERLARAVREEFPSESDLATLVRYALRR
ncbi:MAG: Holliday junction branch migration protein RuvA [Myxococcota bacterium]